MERMNTTPGPAPTSGDNRSLLGLLRHLAQETTALVRSEGELVRAEISQKVSQAETGITSMAVGGLVAFAGAILVLMAIAFFINLFLAAVWLSFLIVGGVTALIGVVMLAKGRSNVKPKNLAPRRTEHALREDKQLAERHLHSSETERSERHGDGLRA